MAEVHLPFSLLPMVDDQETLRVEGATAREVLSQLQIRYPRLAGWVLDEQGRLRQHAALFRGGERIDAEAPLGDGDDLHVVQAISGGSPAAGEDAWQQTDGPAFPEDTGAAVERIWALEAGERSGQLWAGVAPAALFRSDDSGRSWQLVRSLWDEPSRPSWEPGGGGLCLHSICPWPGDPDRLAV